MTGALGEEYKGVLHTIFSFTKFYYLDIISKSKVSEKSIVWQSVLPVHRQKAEQ